MSRKKQPEGRKGTRTASLEAVHVPENLPSKDEA